MDILQTIHDQLDEYLRKVRSSFHRWRNRVSCFFVTDIPFGQSLILLAQTFLIVT